MNEIENWLSITIEKQDQSIDLFEIVVTFTNYSDEVVNWEFNNVLSKAELLSFTLINSQGVLVESLDYMSGTARRTGEQAPEFLPGAVQTYQLKCQLLPSGHLKVGEFHYPVSFEEEYDISFHYGGVKSNVLGWVPHKI
ncbi:MAG: hypothetical protein AB2536_09470 [Candidatus Thiodiazotropha endolucinida]